MNHHKDEIFLLKKESSSRNFLKVVSATFLLVCFLSLKETYFKILDISISWRHPMPKHKTRYTFYLITWEVYIVR